MATIQKVSRKSGYAYRVIIRRKGVKPYSKTFSKKKEADAWARHEEGLIEERDAYPDAIARQKTVSDMLDKFIDAYDGKDHNTPSRLGWWKDQIGHMKLNQVTKHVLNEQLDVLRAERYTQKKPTDKDPEPVGKKRSPATVNRYLAAFSTVLSDAVKWGWLTTNPALGIGRGKETDRFGRYLKDEERDALLTACKASEWPGLYLLVIMALSTGARLGELMSLTWGDLDLKEGLAELSDTKNKDPRVLPLIPPVLEELRAWGKVRRLDNDFVFPDPRITDPEKPRRNYEQGFRRHWEKAKTDAGIENLRFHDLRHSCASYLMQSGASTVAIAEVLGHRTMSMVQRYSHHATEAKAQLIKDVFSDKLNG